MLTQYLSGVEKVALGVSSLKRSLVGDFAVPFKVLKRKIRQEIVLGEKKFQGRTTKQNLITITSQGFFHTRRSHLIKIDIGKSFDKSIKIN